MRGLLIVMMLMAAMVLASAPSMAADVPIAVGEWFGSLANGLQETHSIGVARVIGLGEGDNKTIALAATPVYLNGQKLAVESDRWTLGVDYVYNPKTVLSAVSSYDSEFVAGVGVTATYDAIYASAGLVAVSDDISPNNIGAYVAVGYRFER